MTQQKPDPDTLPPLDAKIHRGLSKLIPGDIVRLERQQRWRPAWDAQIVAGDSVMDVNVRAEKGENYIGPMSLSQEAKVHHILEKHGIPVPHVHGMLENPPAYVMDLLPGQINLATAESDAARASIRRQYIETLANMHRIPLDEFAAIGLDIPTGPRETALNLYAPCERIYRQRMAGRPFALMEFIWRWVQRNVPEHRDRAAFISADSGQFLFQGDRLTGLIDFEVAYVGDPLAEFAGMRLRDSAEPLGDINTLMDHYEALTGDKLDKQSVEYHTAGFCAVNGFLLWPLAFDPAPDDDYVAYLSFSVGTSRWAISAIAENLELTLPAVDEPEPAPVAFPAGGAHMVNTLDRLEVAGDFGRYELSKARSLALYLDRMNRYGRAIIDADLDDAAQVLGDRPASPEAAEEALVSFIQDAGSAEDRQLARYFHRWLGRRDFILAGCGDSAWLTGFDLQKIERRQADRGKEQTAS
jgi:aminoglycoside phosphotransferase (APT) family kinase protein